MKPIRIEAKSEAHARAILGAFQALGYPLYEKYKAPQDHLNHHPYRPGKCYGVNADGVLASWALGPGITHPSIEAAIEELNQTRTVRLSDDYTAEVTPEGVKVGCQTFSFEVMDELFKAVEEVRK